MKNEKFYIIGGGLASLASAAYLVRHGGIPGEQLTVLEENGMTGGSLDAGRIAAGDGYVMRGYRMLEGEVYSCLF
ncbi:MAG TPA: oleate hydratase, partial [Elusimicrobiales bacterium]|nr:oleate hydratase [Elusimicrobiales bacterium]